MLASDKFRTKVHLSDDSIGYDGEPEDSGLNKIAVQKEKLIGIGFGNFVVGA